jgi:hypothetical protein
MSNYIPWHILNSLDKTSETEYARFYNLIITNNFNQQKRWQLRFFELLPLERTTADYSNGYLELLENIDERIQINLSICDKFIPIDENIYQKTFRIIVRKNDTDLKLGLTWHHFEKFIPYFYNDLPLLTKTYLQQKVEDYMFDFDGTAFIELLKLDNSILSQYMDSITKRNYTQQKHYQNHLKKIWILPNAEYLIENSIIQLCNNKLSYWGRNEILDSFFISISEDYKNRSIDFFKKLFQKYHTEKTIIRICFRIIRHTMKTEFLNMIQYFLTVNTDIEIFQSIPLLASSFTGKGDTIWAEIRAKELSEILKAVETLPKQINYIRHKQYLQHCIDSENKQARDERKRMFMRKYN